MTKILNGLVKAIAATGVLITTIASAQANLLTDNSIALGLETGTLTGGLSLKMPYTEQITAQGVIGAIGTVTTFSARGLYHFSNYQAARVYGFGSAGLWTWNGNAAFGSETAFGFGAGVGLDYDLQKAFSNMPPLSVNAEVGANLVSFDNYTGFNPLSIGVGLHYRF